ncbi:electron transport complex subunit RsxC [Bacteroidota bacterium]
MLKTFPKGGVHPEENKLSDSNEIKPLPLPEKVIIPLSQHIGMPSKPIVDKGDKVKTGQIIAKSEGFVSSNIHSSVSGTIEKIDKIIDSTGFKRDAIIINLEGDEWMKDIDNTNNIKKEFNLSGNEIINKILSAGIVGLGGATFPSHVKLSIPKSAKIDLLIINGVECEPYLTADHRLMLEKSEEILTGIELLKKALNVNNAIIGIENNKKDAIDKLSKLCINQKGIKIQGLKVKYPQGSEKQLIKALTKKEVPSGGLPLDVGVICFNVGTAFAVYEAIQKNKPLIERVVTVTGKSLKKPINLMVRIGTPVKNLIEAAGGIPRNCGKIIIGGPMMGKALSTVDAPIIKGSSGIVLVDESESKRKEIINCIRCAKCVSVCPMGLEPYLLMALTENEKFNNIEDRKVMDCIECGSCGYICPSSRPLLDYIRLGKSEVNKLKKKSS